MDKIDYVVNTGNTELIIESVPNTIDVKRVEAYTRAVSDMLVDQLIATRKEKKLNQQAIADMIGIPRANVSRIERKLYTPTLGILMKYADCLGKKITLDLVEK